MFYLQNVNAGFLGNSPYWWAIGGSGYTSRIDRAEKFTADAANEIIRSTKGTHKFKKWPVSKVDKAAHLTIDIQDLRPKTRKVKS